MTWSIVARDPESGAFGVAISTRFFAVGAICPYAMSDVGALSTQALVNPLYGTRGLRLLAEGVAAAAALEILTADDEGKAERQVHLIDRAGRNTAFTGPDCVDWAGHKVAEGVSVAGNMLTGPDVVAETLRAYRGGLDLSFAERLIGALEAGQAAGGDKRGRQSASLLIYAGEEYSALDLRVDDHADPLAELRRLHEVAHERFIPFSQAMPSRARPSGVPRRTEVEALIEQATARRGARKS